jgi:phospholipid/cholesterol/gamma-HCH transport system substrate-binding protein
MSLLRPRSMSELRLGTLLVIVCVTAGLVLFQKQRVMTSIKPGETIAADFARNHRITPFQAPVKIAGVPIGSVTTVKRLDNGTTRIGLKVEGDSLKLMGTAPTVAIRPATLLGGNYYVDVVPGGRRGEFHGTVPISRTRIPVELDSIAAALNRPAREGIRSSISDLGDTLDKDGRTALQDLSEHAPKTLEPASAALGATRGSNPGTDLPRLVRGFEATSRVLSEKNGQLDSSVANLAKLTAVLENRRTDMRRSLDDMPDTLESTDKMLAKLRTTLDTLEDTSDDIRPSVQELDEVLEDLDPVLVKARPVIGDLRVVARDLRPVLDDLTPVADDLTAVFDNVRGPVLDRTNGQILPTLDSGWEGTGLYAGNGTEDELYKVIGYTLSNLTQANMADANGAMGNVQNGNGPGSLMGVPGLLGADAVNQLLNALTGAVQ